MHGCRRLALLATAVLAVALLAGCGPMIRSDSATQAVPGGPVHIVTSVCDTAFPVGTACIAPYADSGQIFAAYELPTGATAPASVTLAANDTETELSRFSSADDTAAAYAAPGPGMHWVGYASAGTVALVPSLTATTLTADVMPAAATPSTATALAHRIFVGKRTFSDTTPLTCNIGPGGNCLVLAPASDGQDYAVAALRDFELAAARDTPVTVGRGETVKVPFTATVAGAPVSTDTADVSGSTTLSGATAVPVAAKLALGTVGASDAPVAVNVPAGAKAGTYDVTLTATPGAGVTRTATAKLRVLSPGMVTPDVSSVAFPAVVATRMSGQATVIFRNTGEQPVAIGNDSVDGASDFPVDADTCAGKSLAPAAACTVTLHFAPTVSGPRAGALHVGPATVVLTGAGAPLLGSLDNVGLVTPNRSSLLAQGLHFTQIAPAQGKMAWQLDVSVWAQPTAALTAKVHRPVAVAKTSKQIAAAGPVDVRLQIQAAKRAFVRRHKHGKLVLRTTFTAADGKVTRTSGLLVLGTK